MARFAAAEKKLNPALREEVLALGPAVIPELLRILSDDTLHLEGGPGAGWPPIHAVDLLADLKATEAVQPMLRLLCETDWDDIIHDRLVLRLAEFGPAVVEPALAILERGVPEDVHHAICCVLADVGVRDPRIYAQLCALFDANEVFGATCLGNYGDPAALPLLEGAIEDFEPNFDSPIGLMDLNELVDSYDRLEGEPSEELAQHITSLRAEFEAYRAGVTPVKKATKPGRNDLCPCASGKKYKRCCLK
jgi:HEAT repeat protein